MIEEISINIAFCTKYDLSIKEGALLSVINHFPNDVTADFVLKNLVGANKKDSVQRQLKRLENKGFIACHAYTDQEVYNLLNNGSNTEPACHFCGIDDLPLHQHHYPVRNKDGGTETIGLCPNCHTRFHNIADYEKKYMFMSSYRKQWNLTESEWNELYA